MVSLDDVSVFITVVEKRSFSAAARELRISPSAVSKRISRLEHDLHATLINRSSRRISLSPAGAAFFDRCAGIRPIVEDATRAVQGIHSTPGGRLRIHVTPGVGTKLITPLIPQFLGRFPDVSVDLITHIADTSVIQQGGDILINSAPEMLPEKLLDHRELGRCAYGICATPEYLQRAGKPKSPRDLTRHNCLVYCNEKGQMVDRWPFEAKSGAYAVDVRGSFAANNSAALYEALIRGSGIALMPIYSVFDAVRSGKVRLLFRNESRFERSLRAYFPRSLNIPINVRLFLDFVTTHLKSLTFDKANGAAHAGLEEPSDRNDRARRGSGTATVRH